MSAENKGGSRKPYVPPRIESEMIQDLSAGGCGKCPTGGVDTSNCPPEDPASTS